MKKSIYRNGNIRICIGLLVSLLYFGSAFAHDGDVKDGELHTHIITIKRPPPDPTPLIMMVVVLAVGITVLWFLPTKKKRKKKK